MRFAGSRAPYIKLAETRLAHEMILTYILYTPCWRDVTRSQRLRKPNLQIWFYEAWQLAARWRSSISQRRHSSFQKSFAQTDTERRFLPSACISQIFGVRTYFGQRTLTRPCPACRRQATLDMQLCCTVLVAAVRALSFAA